MKLYTTILLIIFSVSGCNPFAPALEEGDPFSDFTGDAKTVDGFFTNFKNAYELRDLSLYESLLDSSFTFIYTDFEANADRQWAFAEDLRITSRLFQGSSLILLEWNQIVSEDVTDQKRKARVIRSFDLTVVLDGSDVFRGNGNVNFQLSRPDSNDAWRLSRWRDESSF